MIKVSFCVKAFTHKSVGSLFIYLFIFILGNNLHTKPPPPPIIIVTTAIFTDYEYDAAKSKSLIF